jgi:hypothetical protein
MRDREGVSKNELHEVVRFCDAFVKDYQMDKTKASFQKAEKLLRLPPIGHMVMRKELNDFVAKNWNSALV